MTTDFLSLTVELGRAKTAAAKRSLSKKASTFLASDSGMSETSLYPMIYSALSGMPELRHALDNSFFRIRLASYTDVDGLTKIALGLAYLQDFNDVDPLLDRKILVTLQERVQEANLELVINDYTVNATQVRSTSAVAI